MSFKNIVITGASSGLGAGLAREYATSGVVLGLIGRDRERLEDVSRQAQSQGAATVIGILDVTNAAAMMVWLNDFDTAHPIDLVIANAGISGGPGVMNGENPDRVKKIFDVNLYGVINTIHPVIERMQKRQSGHIAMVSSVAGFRGIPTAPAYTTSKAAVRYYGQALSGLLQASNIDVSVICPGFIRTEMTKVNPFPMPFIMEADKAATIIKRGLEQKKALIVFPWIMGFVVRLLNWLPDSLVNHMYKKVPAKPSN